jgi:O-antigen ligase
MIQGLRGTVGLNRALAMAGARPGSRAGANALAGPRYVSSGSTRVETALVLAFLIMPAAFLLNRIAGFQVSGWAWMLLFGFLAPLALTESIRRDATRLLLPYLLFLLFACASLSWVNYFGETASTGPQLLAQLTVPALAYVLAWRVRAVPSLWSRLQRASLFAMAFAGALAILTLDDLRGPFGMSLAPRPMSMSLVALFVVATAWSISWRYTCLIAACAIAIATLTQSRMATGVLLLVLLTSPSLNLRWRPRLALGAMLLAVVLVLSTTAVFKQRFFFHEDATLVDAITLSENLNTAGRRELWPKLAAECSPVSLTGFGIGASYGLTPQVSHQSINQPHNEYLRIYCDVGWPGSILLWSFFAWAGLRSWRGSLRARRSAQVHGVAAQLIAALLIFAITDNPLAYTAQFMVPLAVVLGLSDRALLEET